MKRILRRFVVAGLERSGTLPAVRRRGDRERIVILRYHSVSETDPANFLYRCPSIAVRPDTFARQMEFLANHYHVVSLDAVADALSGGREIPRGTVAITFDDGYRDNHEHALPILRAHSFPATVYVTTDAIGDGWNFWLSRVRYALGTTTHSRVDVPGLGAFALASPGERRLAIDEATGKLKRLPVDERDAALERLLASAGVTAPPEDARNWFLDRERLRELSRAGISIGAHTRSHPILTRQTTEVATAEIRGSRHVLEEAVGSPVLHFAYPNGGGVLNHDERVIPLVRDAGFSTATTSVNGPVRLGDNPFRLRRVGIAERHGVDGFRLNLERDRLVFVPGWKRGTRPRLLVVGPSPG
ncbi:polysaccharide deacetylase family protein, partial [bacterium]|nr:polysaccharide deacetylase family protein [bacterium]